MPWDASTLARESLSSCFMEAPTCQEPRLRHIALIYLGLTSYQEVPCGRAATAWHNGRLMCRRCRSAIRRAEARDRRATEGGVLGTLVNAAPGILLGGFALTIHVIAFVLDREFREEISKTALKFGYCLFAMVMWAAFEATDSWLVRTWQRRRKGAKEGRGRLG